MWMEAFTFIHVCVDSSQTVHNIAVCFSLGWLTCMYVGCIGGGGLSV